MDTLEFRAEMYKLTARDEHFGDLGPDVIAKLISTAADIALVIDAKGVVRDISFDSDELADDGCEAWIDRPWVDTVTVESRAKIEALLRDASANAPVRWRQVNHRSKRGGDIPIRYFAMSIGGGRTIGIGRDLRALTELQKGLVDAQQSMEREYAKIRHAETRYRMLFEFASEAVAIVDATSYKIIEANPVAARALGKARRVVGRNFLSIFDSERSQAVQEMLLRVRTGGRAGEIQVRLADNEAEHSVSASLFRHDNTAHFIVRLTPVDRKADLDPSVSMASKLMKVIESLPDGFVVTDLEQRILTANQAFLDLAQLATVEQAQNSVLDRWIGRSGVDVGVLIANLREHGSIRHFSTVLRGEYGVSEDVEISAVAVLQGEQPCFGFTIRKLGRRAVDKPRAARDIPKSVEQMTELVGRVSLKDLVQETTDIIERLCIEAALELTGDNRASAAELLGLSRQSLYVKLRRHGLGDLNAEPDKQ